MTVNSNQIVQSRDILAYIAAYASSNAMPADSAWGTAPGGTYRDIGSTDGGLGFNIGMTYEDVTVDQSIDPVAVVASGRDVHLTGTMAELTPQNLKDATSQGTLSTVAASSGVRGHTDLAFDNTIAINYLTVLFDIKHALGDSEAIRLALWRGQVRSAVQTTFGATAKAALGFDVQAFPDPNNSNRVLTYRDISAALP